jgi:hypothetical protein
MPGVLLNDLDYDFVPSMGISGEIPAVYMESIVNGKTVTIKVSKKEVKGYLKRFWDGKKGFVGFVQKLSKQFSKRGKDESYEDALVEYEEKNNMNNKDEQILNMLANFDIETSYAADESDLPVSENYYYGYTMDTRYMSVPGAG